MDSASKAAGERPKFSGKNVLLVAVPAAVIVIGIFAWLYNAAQREAPGHVDFLASTKGALLAPITLAEGLIDKDGDLVADAPTDAAALLDPEMLVFEVLGQNLELEQTQWADFVQHLQTATGKQVKLQLRPDRAAGAEPPPLRLAHDMRAGAVHLAALNTGAVNLGVNVGGAIPFCVMADKDGKFGYEMEIIVPASSSVQKVSELKGSKRLLFGSTYSHSGFKAPLITLWKEFDLHPERDYTPVFTASSEQAIADIAAGRGDAAPVASDFLQRVISRDKIKPDSIRSIYKSKEFPPACFAYAHQLQPELAAKIKTAFLDFEWKDSSLEKAYAPAHQSKFVPASYKEDWTAVREVEERAAALLKMNGGS